MSKVETPKVDPTNDELAGSDDPTNDETNDDQTNDDGATKTVDPAELALVKLVDLTVTSFKDKSAISNLDKAASLWSDFESAATDWFDARKKSANASRRAAIATVRMAELVVDEKGNPIWSAQASVMAWRVLYQDRVKPLYVELTKDSDDDKAVAAFELAVRRYIADRHLKFVAIADYCVRTTNGLGTKPFTTGRGTPDTSIRDAVSALLADEKPDNMSALESYKWNADLAKAIKPHIARQVVTTGENKGKLQRGFDHRTTFAPIPETVTPDIGSGSGSGAGTADHYKAAIDKLVEWANGDHWNPLGSTEAAHEIISAYAVKYMASVKQVRGRKDVVAGMREISALLDVLADFVEDAGKTGKPSKDDVSKHLFVN